MLTLTVSQPTNNLVVSSGIPFLAAGRATDRGMLDPAVIDSVIVQVDNGPPIEAALTPVPVVFQFGSYSVSDRTAEFNTVHI
jgi:hypothetical protein